MIIQTSRFGDIEVREEDVIIFPGGLYGFENSTRYCIIDVSPESPLKWLQSLSEPSLAVVIASPFAFFPSYDIEIADEELCEVSQGSQCSPDVMCIVTVSRGASFVTMNLRAPLVVYSDIRTGRQVILQDASYDTRAPLPMAKEEEI